MKETIHKETGYQDGQLNTRPLQKKKKQSKEDRDIHDNVEDLLEKLASDTSELMSRVGEGPGGSIYCVNIKRIMDIARSKLVEAVVKDRFGVQGISLT